MEHDAGGEEPGSDGDSSRRPEEASYTNPNRGSPYVSDAIREVLPQGAILREREPHRRTMGQRRRRSCYATLKTEFGDRRHYRTREQSVVFIGDETHVPTMAA